MFKILLFLFSIGTTLALNVQSKNEGIGHQLTPQLKARFDAAYSVVENVNLANAGWEARMYPRFARMSEDERRAMNGLLIDENEDTHEAEPFQETPMLIKVDNLPEEFDLRQQFPQCASVINNIRDQSKCGSCWAVGAAGAISDRICIKSKGKVRVSVSDFDIASCAMKGRDGCKGGRLSWPWTYMHKHGTVTGGKFHSDIGCKPYPFPPMKDAPRDYSTPACMEQCSNILYDEKTYAEDIIKVGKPIRLRPPFQKLVDEHVLMQEVFVNGSVEVGFVVYEDFRYYSKGVYKVTDGAEELGGHAVRLIGWGVENGTTPYWLLANSWGPEWGENGFFRIRRGVDEASIESLTSPFAADAIL